MNLNPTYDAGLTIDSRVAHYLVIGASLFGIAWGIFNVIQVSVSDFLIWAQFYTWKQWFSHTLRSILYQLVS